MKKVVTLFLILLLLASCKTAKDDPSPTPTAVNQTETSTTDSTSQPTIAVQTGAIILADGTLTAVTPSLPLSFNTNGRLLTIHVQAGDTVSAGERLATLDDQILQDNIITAQQQIDQAAINLAQAELSLNNLLEWEADETAVALAEANVAAAEAGVESAAGQDAAASNNMTSVNVNVNQAQRGLEDALEAQTTAYDPGREWELNDPWRSDALKNEREGADRAVQSAQESLSIARANYSLTAASVNGNSALNAEASLLNAQQALEQAQTPPKASEIEAAELNVEQAALTLAQNEESLARAERALADANIIAPWDGQVLSIETAVGGMVSAGTPILTLIENGRLQFHTNNLSERDLAQIVAGQPAAINLKAFSSETVMGTVARIAPQASGLVGDAATFVVIIDIDPDTALDLRTGMTGRVEIEAE